MSAVDAPGLAEDLVGIDLDVVFGARDGQVLALDLYTPAGPPRAAPLVVFLHGGGGTSGDKSQGRERALAAAERGLAVACVQYRVDGRPGLDAWLDHVGAALDWLRDHGPDHGVRGDRLVLWGISMGGYLAAVTALSAGRRGIVGVVEWYGPVDLPALAARTPLERHMVADAPEERILPGRGSDPAALRAASPVHLVTDAAPPFLIAHGDRDQVVPDSHARALHAALVRHDVPSTLLMVGGAGHDDARFDTPEVFDLVAAFARRRLDGPAG